VIRITAWALAGLAGFLVAGSAIFSEATMRVPRRTSSVGAMPTVPGVAARTVTVRTFDRAVLEAWFFALSEPPRGCVVLLHGIGDSRSGAVGFAPMFLHAGYSVLVPDGRGHGRSGGDVVTYGLLEKYDILAWAGWLREQGCRNLYGLGESLGGAALIEASALRPQFRAIAAECSYADLRSVAEYRVQHLSGLPAPLVAPFAKLLVAGSMLYARLIYGLDFRGASPLAAVSRTSTPVLLIHGVLDTETPCWHSQMLARANPKTVLWLVPNAGHTAAYSANPAEFQRQVLGWFARH
jgi:pimeloyl-ACP methyl ester carboxylesterase